MDQSIFLKGNRFQIKYFSTEEEFETMVYENSKTFFGNKSVLFDIKKKVKTKTLNDTIPDGFLFDFREEDNPAFYMIEVELSKHSFYSHIFPQITKFFAFLNNKDARNKLIDQIYDVVKNDKKLEEEFKKNIGGKETYKTIKDAIENNSNILLILDDEVEQLKEVKETYPSEWGKLVKVIKINQFSNNSDIIHTITPNFEDIEYIDLESPKEGSKENNQETYDEYYHLEGVSEEVKKIYQSLKEKVQAINPKIIFNPTKWYISIKLDKNIAYINLKIKKLKIVITQPYDPNLKLNHSFKPLAEGVERFYNSKCFQITIEHNQNLDEVVDLIKKSINN